MPELSKYYPELKSFASKLGWDDLEEFAHVVTGVPTIPDGTVIRLWESAPHGYSYFLQIQYHGIWAVQVHALKFRIVTGWHEFNINAKPEAEAKRLYGLLGAEWFQSREGRAAFRSRHPECTNFTWHRIRTEGLPYRTT